MEKHYPPPKCEHCGMTIMHEEEAARLLAYAVSANPSEQISHHASFLLTQLEKAQHARVWLQMHEDLEVAKYKIKELECELRTLKNL